MEHPPEHNPTKPEPDQKDYQGELKQGNGRNSKPRVVRLRLYEVFAALFFVFAGFFLSADRKWHLYAITSLLAGLILSGFSLRLWLINHQKTHSKSNFWLAVVLIPSVVLCLWLLRAEWTSIKPHLALYLSASDTPEHTLILTNDFFLIKGRGPKAQIPDKSGFIVIRTPFDRTNTVLRFGVLNDSAPQYAVVDDSALTVDAAYLELMVINESDQATAITWSHDPAWKQSRPANKGVKMLRFTFPNPLLAGAGDRAPDLTFTNSAHLTDKQLVIATLRGRGVPQINLLFNLVFIPSNESIAPSVLGPTNAVAAMILRKAN